MSRLILLFVAAGALALAQEIPAPPAGGPPAAGPQGAAGAREAAEPKPYDRVITKDAQTQDGVFKVHKIKNRTYYEIPKKELGKEFLLVVTVAKTVPGVAYAGYTVTNRVVRWDRVDNRVMLRTVSYETRSADDSPISRNVQAISNPTILQAFNVESVGKDDAPVIEVTRFFGTETPELSPRAQIRARGFDASRSYLESARAYPLNIEVDATHTFTSPIEPPSPGQAAPAMGFAGGMRPGSATLGMHYSMVKLPENPMKPRLADSRVGFFGRRYVDYDSNEHRAATVRLIDRWRLEKKDPSAAVSEPVKPITFYVDPATPAKWVPYIKSGIEAWKPAYEAAGFRNGIVAKEAPKDDPTWSPEDARYSVVRWQPSTIENAMGPHISDPRTGEILDADIQIYHNVLNLIRFWYFTQVGPLDPRAKTIYLPDDLQGKLLEYVVAHEVGHSLGLPHNMKASSLYPFEKMRDNAWLKENSHTPTIMDYSRFDYVAQPEDKIDPAWLIPRLGPYDFFSIQFGYKEVPNAKTPEDEAKILGAWVATEQDKTPWLRFSTPRALGSDPGENTEAVGDADAVKATALGLKNLERVMEMLPTATVHPDREFDELDESYKNVVRQWTREMNHVAALIGGYDSQEKHFGQNGPVFTPVPAARQQEAVKFLADNVLQTPKLFIRPEILRKIEAQGILDRVRDAQRGVLMNMIGSARIQRLTEQEAISPQGAYRTTTFLSDIRKGIYTELLGAQPKVDAYRRNTQRLYIDLLGERLNGRVPVADDQRPLFRGELRAISALASSSIARATDPVTRLHLEDLRDQVARVLDPKFAAPAAPAGPFGGVRTVDGFEREKGCWEQ